MLRRMPRPEPFVWLPDHIWLTRDEAKIALWAADIAEAAGRSPAERAAARQAQRLITRKLWDDLADILEMNGEDHG